MKHKCNRKKILHCCKKERKMLHSYFILPGGFRKSQQNCNHSFPLLPLNSGFGDAAELLLHMCFIISLSQAVMKVKFSIKESSFNRQTIFFFHFSFLTETFSCNYFLFKYNIFAISYFLFKYNTFAMF